MIPDRVTDSQSFYDELARAQRGEQARRPRSCSSIVADARLPPPTTQAAQNAFFQAYRFYHRPGSQRPDLPEDLRRAIAEAARLRVPRDALRPGRPSRRCSGASASSSTCVVELDAAAVRRPASCASFRAGDLPADSAHLSGHDATTSTDRWFGARPASEFRMTRGLLRLSPEVYDLFQVDVDGAALKAVDFGAALER